MAYIGNSPSSATFAIDTFSGDNTTVNFTLREAPLATSSIIVFVGGVRQQTDSYSLSSSTLVFSEAPPLGTNNVEVIFLGLGASASIPSDGSVTSQKILAGAVTGDKLGLTSINANNIVDASITGAKLASATITGDKLGLTSINANNLVDASITGGKLSSTLTTGNINFVGATSFLSTVYETANVSTLMGATTTINVSQPLLVFTANSSANSTVNFIGLGGMPVGNTASFVIINPNSSTPKYISGFQIDGSSITPKWAGGAPATITPANTDIYTVTVIKTAATPTYNVFASIQSFY
jgi:hypothetical protein